MAAAWPWFAANALKRFDIVLTDFYDFEPKEPFDAIVIMGVIEHLPDYEHVSAKCHKQTSPETTAIMPTSAMPPTGCCERRFARNHDCYRLMLHKPQAVARALSH
jgi:2-polyprenyl-3-methyl-5-hydroxy-6-metoxy-1,4-benzoquinol methylase